MACARQIVPVLAIDAWFAAVADMGDCGRIVPAARRFSGRGTAAAAGRTHPHILSHSLRLRGLPVLANEPKMAA